MSPSGLPPLLVERLRYPPHCFVLGTSHFTIAYMDRDDLENLVREAQVALDEDARRPEDN